MLMRAGERDTEEREQYGGDNDRRQMAAYLRELIFNRNVVSA